MGYRVFATPDTLATFSRGSTATVLTELVVREDSRLFTDLLSPISRNSFAATEGFWHWSTNGAVVLRAAPARAVPALSHSDTAALQKVPGVGKRVAERLVVELKIRSSQ
ncbi:MAG: helix-hairpin-helix domain-containing protein [Lawsonella clevelandensis]